MPALIPCRCQTRPASQRSNGWKSLESRAHRWSSLPGWSSCRPEAMAPLPFRQCSDRCCWSSPLVVAASRCCLEGMARRSSGEGGRKQSKRSQVRRTDPKAESQNLIQLVVDVFLFSSSLSPTIVPGTLFVCHNARVKVHMAKDKA